MEWPLLIRNTANKIRRRKKKQYVRIYIYVRVSYDDHGTKELIIFKCKMNCRRKFN